MDLGYLKISRLPLKVFYDEDAVNSNKRLPSEQRNIDIIRGITFIQFLKLLKENNESNIKSWFYEHDNKLRKHLNKMQEKFKQKPHTKYCKNLNYILDFVVQAIDNLNDIKYARVKHEFDENSRNILQSYTSLNCLRDLRNSENKNLYIKKIMYDLLDDIEYMLSRQNNQIRAQCLKMFNRIKYRRGILGNIYNTVSDRSIFHSDKNCNLSIIAEKFSGLNCNKTPKVPQTVTVAEPQPVTELPSSEEDLLEPRASEDGEEPIDVGDLEISLPVNEDPPKLDTTYAAASLAGISLFGTILYKYRPFGLGSNLRRGARNGSNIFPLDNNVYDANIMNNFEYLQTGIPNDEYQLGYGSVTDY